MPPGQVRAVIAVAELQGPCEVQNAQGRDVGHGIGGSGDHRRRVVRIGEMPFQEIVKRAEPASSARRQFGYRRVSRPPGNRPVRVGRVRVPERIGDSRSRIEFHDSLPALYLCPREGVGAHEGRIRAGLLEITADGDGFVDDRAVVENEHGKQSSGADGEEIRVEVLARQDIDLFSRQVDAFLGEKNPNPARVGRSGRVIELHGRLRKPDLQSEA